MSKKISFADLMALVPQEHEPVEAQLEEPVVMARVTPQVEEKEPEMTQEERDARWRAMGFTPASKVIEAWNRDKAEEAAKKAAIKACMKDPDSW